MKLLATLLLGVTLLPEGAPLRAEIQAQDSDSYVSEEYGFRIQRPAARWSFIPQRKAPGSPGEDQAKFTLTLSSIASSASLVVYVADWDRKTAAESVRDAAVAKLESLGAREIVSGSETLAGLAAPSVGCLVSGVDGRDYAVSLRYLTENGFVYAVQTTELEELPVNERRAARALLLHDVLGHRLEDGSFLDLPALGRAYGTGMALIAMRELLRER